MYSQNLPTYNPRRVAKIILLILAGGVVPAIVASCARQERPGDTRDRSSIKIGYFGDLSGPTFNFGQSAKNGAIMGADEINQGGGINGRKIDIVIEDDEGSPELAATVINKLTRQDKVIALIAGGASGSSLAAGPNAQSAKVPMISPSSTNPAVTQIGDYVFRACFIDPFQGEVMAKFSYNSLQARTAAIMLDFNSPYSRDLTEFFELSFTKLGGRVISKQSYTQGDSDFKGQLSSIGAARPDVIYLPGYYGDIAVIAKQARQLGITQPLLGGDGWDAPELWQLAGDSINGSYISNHYSAEDPSPAIQKFVKDYKLHWGNLTPDAHAALAYDAMRFLAEAIQRAGTTEGGKLRDALAQTRNFSGVTGIISMDSERNAVKSAVILKLQDGSYIYQETIKPEAAVSAAKASPSASPSPKKSRKK
ncbi:MAG: ABC transporter substrate-binding protein [Pyrinomonadaceae bacterium]|nr:ABC transporter substrate-binding protein [Pyrinomonadaceae bacterium]